MTIRHYILLSTLACCPLAAQQRSTQCAALVAESKSAAGLPFDKQSKEDQAIQFTRVTRTFNGQLLLTLARVAKLRTDKEFQDYDRQSALKGDFCYKEWNEIAEFALKRGLYTKQYMQGDLQREIKLEDELFKRLLRIVAAHVPVQDTLDD